MLTILDKANPSPSESLCADEFSAVMAVPMFVRDRLLGVIYADKDGHQQPFNRSQARLVEQFADQAKIAIHNAYLYMRATIDHMTRLYKRSYFDSRLEEELARSDRYDSPVTLLMLDLDHFKKLNDTHGHLAGDEVLRLIGHIIKTSVRGHDIAARYGGEEFSVIMPQLDLVGAVRVAKRIKRRIQHQSRLDHKLTISIGAAELQPGQTPEQLISKADRALYRAKKTGRNKVCTWRPGGSRRLLTSVKETKKKS
jgi:diguanylate cyclase (GGDEF)-like protein